ncbi:MAG TPA: GlxA family transcriptional regulator [Longimicrobium sp.]|jgi:transcriptional regulator GlxA family with amidase domain|uniref:GlxA family transcriptional regulator n=1 Tax=Longimicrobium sp. TaxID=2029185 RepID=UPI002EDB3C94
MQRVTFVVLPGVDLLDLAGPVEVFHAANPLGGDYHVRIAGPQPAVRARQGVALAELEPLPDGVGAGDLVVVPGMSMESAHQAPASVHAWLRGAHDAGAHVCSVCVGAFVLADAGLLHGRQCTTHWSCIAGLRERHPDARVLDNRLFVDDGRITTSAGIASGIDMALSMVERRHGPLVAAAVARELVVYLRRDGAHQQQSVYLDYRTHLHPGIHRVQDWLVAHPAQKTTLEALGRMAFMSPRHLTRTFRQATGISIKEFTTRLRLELARNLLNDPALTIEAVAARCGFDTPRQLRRVWKEAFGTTPGAARAEVAAG